jgi:aryl-alcohol dehydrogenase-like predicted oxidoreductase
LDETLRAYEALIAKGKVRVIGASNYTAPRLAAALEVSQQGSLPTYQVLQPHYNLYDRPQYEAELERVCIDYGLGVVVYFALARGFLSGKYRSTSDLNKSPRAGSVKANYFNPRGTRILTALDTVASSVAATPSQIALAWIMARPSVSAPIASATSVAQVNELCGAMSLQLNTTAIDLLNEASAP